MTHLTQRFVITLAAHLLEAAGKRTHSSVLSGPATRAVCPQLLPVIVGADLVNQVLSALQF